MTGTDSATEVDGGDVMVIGGGASGLTCAALLVERGLSVSVVDVEGVGAGQSGHHHGLLHRGCLYVGASREFVAAMTRGRAAWDRWLDSASPSSDETFAAFWDRWQARRAEHWWRDVGLDVEAVDAPDWMRKPIAVYATGERSFDFTGVLERLLATVGHDHAVKGEVEALETKSQQVVAARLRLPNGTLVKARAGRYVVAAGCGISGVISKSGMLARRLVNRRSFMLVVEAPSLPLVTMLTPEATHTGLFTGARSRGATNAWLVGDHVSYAGVEANSATERSWARATLKNLRSSTTLLDRPAVQVGVYTAPKAELRESPRQLGQWSVDGYDLTNCLVVTPTKLTLAAAMAEEAVTALLRTRPQKVPSGLDPLVGDSLRVMDERWHSVPMAPVEDLSG
jgi:glycine/D-amino acid oxidase-like deaminating enzyme